MPTIRIDLREGFDGEDVRIDVDGDTILERSDVATDYSIGLAATVEHEVSPGEHDVAVVTRVGSITKTVVASERRTHLGVVMESSGPRIALHDGPDRAF